MFLTAIRRFLPAFVFGVAALAGPVQAQSFSGGERGAPPDERAVQPPPTPDLSWSASTGWSVEGGAITGLSGEDNREALQRMNKARRAEEAGREGSAAKNYERVAKRYPNSIWAAEALYRAGDLRLQRRQFYKAFEDYQLLLSRYPGDPRFSQVVGVQYNIASALFDGARNRIWGIIPGFRNRERSIQYFETILYNAPYSDYAPLALMNVARGHQRLGNDIEAIDALDRMINFYPKNFLAPDAYLELGQTHASLVDGPYYDQASTREAITYFEDFMILFPSEPTVSQAAKGLDEMRTTLAKSKMLIADYYLKYRRNYQGARVFYNEVITVYPDSPVAAEAREKLAKVEKLQAEQKAAFEAALEKAKNSPPKKKKRFWLF